jgi:hypothetical protein
MASHAWGLDLDNEICIENHAKELHDLLNDFKENSSSPNFFGSNDLSPFDLVVYAYLKEEMFNTSESEMVRYLVQNCANLVAFVKHMD